MVHHSTHFFTKFLQISENSLYSFTIFWCMLSSLAIVIEFLSLKIKIYCQKILQGGAYSKVTPPPSCLHLSSYAWFSPEFMKLIYPTLIPYFLFNSFNKFAIMSSSSDIFKNNSKNNFCVSSSNKSQFFLLPMLTVEGT